MAWLFSSNADRAYSETHLINFKDDYETGFHFNLSVVDGGELYPLFAISNDSGQYDFFGVYQGNLYVECESGFTSGSAISPETTYYVSFGRRINGTSLFIALAGTDVATLGNDPVGRSDAQRIEFGGFRGSSKFCAGWISQPRSWIVDLTQEQREAEMVSAVAVLTSDLWADWQTPQGAEFLNDFSGNNRHLTEAGSIEYAPNAVGGVEDIEITPDITDGSSATIDPLVVLGSINYSDTLSGGSIVIGPDVVLGSITNTPAGVSGSGTAIDPEVVQNSISLSPEHGSAGGTAVEPVVVLSSITLSTPVIAGSSAAIDPSVILGSLSISAVASGLTNTFGPEVIQSSQILAPEFGTGTTSASLSDVVMGSITLTPAVDSAGSSAVAPNVILDSMTLSPDAISAGSSAVSSNVVLGSITFTPDVALIGSLAVDPDIQFGSTSAFPDVVDAQASAILSSVLLGSISITPDAGISAGTVHLVVVDISGSLVAPVFATGSGDVFGPDIILGSLSIITASVSGAGTAVLSFIDQDDTFVSPNAAVGTSSSIDPVVIIVMLPISPGLVIGAGLAVGPSIVMSSMTILPDVVIGAGAVFGPVVTVGNNPVVPPPGSDVVAVVGLLASEQLVLRDLFSQSRQSQSLLTHIIPAQYMRRQLEAHPILRHLKIWQGYDDVVYSNVHPLRSADSLYEIRFTPVYIGIQVDRYTMSGNRPVISNDASSMVVEMLMTFMERGLFRDFSRYPGYIDSPFDAAPMGYRPSGQPISDENYALLLDDLPSIYRSSSAYYMSSATARTVTDTEDKHIDDNGIPHMLIGRPVRTTPFLPNPGADERVSVVFGNISKAYLYGCKIIAQYVFSESDMLFIIEIMQGGAIVNPDAIRIIKVE